MTRQKGSTLFRFLALALFLGGLLVLVLHVGEEPVLATDTDEDGISDSMEAVLGTDPEDSDSDSDSLSDFDEVFVHGTDPNLADSDGDSLSDSVDSEPLYVDSWDGVTTPTQAFDANLARSALTGNTPFEGYRVNACSGQLETKLATIDFGPGYMGRNKLVLYYLSGIEHNGRWGRNVVCNWDWWIHEENDDDVIIYMFGSSYLVDEDSGAYASPDGFPFTVTKDGEEDEIIVTAIRGGKMWVFDATDGWLLRIEDRFGNTLEIDRDQYGAIETVTLPEGNEVAFTQTTTGRYQEITDCDSGRMWCLMYNVKDQLARFVDAEQHITQFFYVNGSDDEDLNSNLVRIKLPGDEDLVKVEYDASDRVSRQHIGVGAGAADFTYTSTSTTVNDFAGNQRVWNYASGAIVPNSLVQYSNRDVRATDPATWTTTMAHDANLLRTKVVFPEGNRVDFDWDSHYCLTEKRFKATDTDTDSEDDLVWTYTYGSTYYQLEDSTDARGNTTERTLDNDELVTQVDYETVTHPDPDVSISESFTYDSHGMMLTHTDGEGAVTRYEYYSSGAKTGLLWKVTVDYGSGKLNLVTELDYNQYGYLNSKEDPDGYEWTFTTDMEGRRTTSTSPSPQDYEIVYIWDSNGYLSQKDVENVDETNTRDATNPFYEGLCQASARVLLRLAGDVGGGRLDTRPRRLRRDRLLSVPRSFSPIT